jgi:hypothetical protein
MRAERSQSRARRLRGSHGALESTRTGATRAASVRRLDSLPGSTLLGFVEEHRGALSAIGIFGGFSGLIANPAISQYVIATFGFLMLLFLHELQSSAPRGDSEAMWMFRTALSFAVLVLFLGWSVQVAPMRPSFSLLPPVVFCAWSLQWTASRNWPKIPQIVALAGVLGALGIAVLLYVGASALDLLRLMGVA